MNMPAVLSVNGLARLLREGARNLEANHETLSRLDAATGDGDHGATMRKIARAICGALPESPSGGAQALLEAVGWSVLSVDGGSAAPLFGCFFMGMSTVALGETVEGPALAAAFEAGLAQLRAQTPAQPGDKTLLDALVPAVEALRAAIGAGAGIDDSLAAAAAAAAQGMEHTKAMQARFGRARNLGARSIGPADPGATSVALLFAGFAGTSGAGATNSDSETTHG